MSAPMNAHWAEDYIGLPWSTGFTCWDFAVRIWAERFGWQVSPVDIEPADPRGVRRGFEAGGERARWQEVAHPCEGDGVLMGLGNRPCHVGVWLDLGGVLHSIEGAGGIFTPKARLGDLGYRQFGIYRRCG